MSIPGRPRPASFIEVKAPTSISLAPLGALKSIAVYRRVPLASGAGMPDKAALKLEDQADIFARSPRLYGLRDFVADGSHGGHGEINHELNAVGGWSNPLSPGLNMWIDGDKAFGTVRCGYAYEGPPGHVHGGFVAAILDQFLGMAQLAGGLPGMTGSLEIRYLKPTPLNTDLSLEATVEPAGGRKTRVKGEIRNGDTITATAEGLFIRPKSPIARPFS